MHDPKIRYGVLGALGLGLLIFGAPKLLAPSSLDFLSTQYALQTAADGPVSETALCVVEPLRLSRGQNLADAFLQAGVDPRETANALAALGETLDLRRLRPRDEFLIYRARSGELRRVEVERGLTEDRVILEASGSDFHTLIESKRVDRYLRKLEGEVQDNLFFAMQEAGGNAGVVISFADLFAWDFDFASETRSGDRFRLLVEERYVDGHPAGFGRILTGEYLPTGQTEPLRAYHYAWADGDQEGYYTADARSVRKFFLKSPLNFSRISSGYTHKRFHPVHKIYRPHLGVDYAAPTGTPVVALGNGRIVFQGWKGGYGRTVQVRHNKTYLTQYAHLSRYAKGLKSGSRVKQGQIVGYVGSSGVATGPHLDFRVQQNGSWINPLRLKGGQSEPLPAAQREAFAADAAKMDTLLDRMEIGQRVPLDGGESSIPALALARLDTPAAS